MDKLRLVLDFLKTKDEFYYWGSKNIQIEPEKVVFNSFKLDAANKVSVRMRRKGFEIKLLRKKLLVERTLQEYNNVKPKDVHDCINHIIFYHSSH